MIEYNYDVDAAPKDGRPVLWYGVWRPYPPSEGGSPIIVMANWSTIMSNGTGYHWMVDTFGDLHENYNVDWKAWFDATKLYPENHPFPWETIRPAYPPVD